MKVGPCISAPPGPFDTVCATSVVHSIAAIDR